MNNLTTSILGFMPEIFLAVSAMIILIAGAFQKDHQKGFETIYKASIGVLVLTAFGVALIFGEYIGTIFAGQLILDNFAYTIKLLILIGAIGVLASSLQSLFQLKMNKFEYPVLILLAVLGMMVMVSANSMLTLYLGLELQSLSLYILATFDRNNLKSSEAGMKYFVLGALSSGMLLFGISLIYGYTGQIGFDAIANTLLGVEINQGFIVGMVFVLAGLIFKVSAVPFHMWTPDVYQGAPTPVTAFFAAVPKIAAMALLIRVLFVPFEAVQGDWMQILWLVSLLSMILGAFAGIGQDSIKRLLAYSSIGNIGFALIGLVAGSAGASATLSYMVIYMVATLSVFAILMCLNQEGASVTRISNLAGLSKSAPGLSYAMAILMFSMAGIPPVAGFFAKLYVFNAAVDQGLILLAVLGIVTSVIAAYYYLRVIKVMFFDDGEVMLDKKYGAGKIVVITLGIAFVTLYILFPQGLLTYTDWAVQSLM